MTSPQNHEFRFRPRARLVSILGEHLISDHAVGLIELVKNSYDADATEVTVELTGLEDPESTTIAVHDNGVGMTVDDIRDKWLSPAVDHKERDKHENRRTAFGRIPVGEKGVGRFAVHQLGRDLEMVTRAHGGPEVVLQLNWDAFVGDAFLDGMAVNVIERDPEIFERESTGTRIVVRRPRSPWSPKLLRKVHRTLRRLQSPLAEEDTRFRVRLSCPEYPELENVDPTDMLPKAHYEFRALIDEHGKCDMEYVCKHPAVRHREEAESSVDLTASARDELQGDKPRSGPFWINLYVWDRSKDHLQASGVSRPELDALCGVSLFRDGLRVLPYGEAGDDWLLLDQERIQAPAERIGNNQVIGLVQFNQSANLLLRDKTNREGLIENDAFLDLRALVRAAIRQFTKYWKADRPEKRPRQRAQPAGGSIRGARAVATALKDSASDDVAVSLPGEALADDASDARQAAELDRERPTREPEIVTQRRAVDLLIAHLDGAEHSMRERDHRLEVLLQLAGTGLAAERVVHEFGRHVAQAWDALREIRRIRSSLEQIGAPIATLGAALEVLQSEFRVIAPYEFTRPAERARLVDVRETAELAIELNRGLAAKHSIDCSVVGDSWQTRLRPTPLLQILDNLVHNACSWVAGVEEDALRRVAIRVEPEEGKVLVLDSGPGIDGEAASHVLDPFFTMKAGGKGLGLYISSELAKKLGGSLRLADERDADLVAAWATGAAFVLDLPWLESEETNG